MNGFIDETKIQDVLGRVSSQDKAQVREILAKALEYKGLGLSEVACLFAVTSRDLLEEIFVSAKKVKEEIYGKRIVIFAPLYVSNLCTNECVYCAFRAANKSLKRKYLSSEEIALQTKFLIDQGHKRILLLAGEAYPQNNFQYVLDAIDAIYSVKTPQGEIRRVNINVAPLGIEDFKRLKERGIGTYQLFQETYHRDTYKEVHLSGKKSDYDWRLGVFERAFKAGIDDIGLGVLFGLYDWRFEVLALLQHIEYLEANFGIGPHTVSVPRLEPALGSEVASKPMAPVSDIDFCKLVAILRLAVPYTGIIMSTRETAKIRQQTLALGVSQISAGSRTSPGGYGDTEFDEASQFSLGDHRSLDEVVCDLTNLGYTPSFCTACYRVGRTGEDFMCLAKSGKIKDMCNPNAIASFVEYLNDYGDAKTKEAGHGLITNELAHMQDQECKTTTALLKRLEDGEHDVFI